jgi:hypothetical protein
VRALSAGIDNLILMSKEVQQKVFEVGSKAGGGGGVGSGDGRKKWRVGELEFEAWMRLLDNMVCPLFKYSYRCFNINFTYFLGIPNWLYLSESTDEE